MFDPSLILSREHPKIGYSSWIIAVVYLVALLVAEALTTLIAPLAGMILHGMIFIALMIQSALSTKKEVHRFLMVLALAPLIRLLSLTLPLVHFPQIYWYALVGLLLYFAAFICSRTTGLTAKKIGLRLSWRDLPAQSLIGISGLLIGYIEYLILQPEPLITNLSWESFLLAAVILLVFTGLLEEIIFRGLMQTSAIQLLGRIGILYTAILFAILHLGYRSLVDVVFVFVVALVFGYLVHRTGSLVGVSISHGLTNISLYLIFPFLLAGPAVGNFSVASPISPENAVTHIPTQELSNTTPTQSLPAGQALIPITGPTSVLAETGLHPEPTLVPTETTSITCSLPPTWVVYTVQAGDTIMELSDRYGVDVDMLLFINCLEAASHMTVGQQLFVPFEFATSTTLSSSLSPGSQLQIAATKTTKRNPAQHPTSTQLPAESPPPTQVPTAVNTRPPTPTNAPTISPPTNEPTYPSLPTGTPEE